MSSGESAQMLYTAWLRGHPTNERVWYWKLIKVCMHFNPWFLRLLLLLGQPYGGWPMATDWCPYCCLTVFTKSMWFCELLTVLADSVHPGSEFNTSLAAVRSRTLWTRFEPELNPQVQVQHSHVGPGSRFGLVIISEHGSDPVRWCAR